MRRITSFLPPLTLTIMTAGGFTVPLLAQQAAPGQQATPQVTQAPAQPSQLTPEQLQALLKALRAQAETPRAPEARPRAEPAPVMPQLTPEQMQLLLQYQAQHPQGQAPPVTCVPSQKPKKKGGLFGSFGGIFLSDKDRARLQELCRDKHVCVNSAAIDGTINDPGAIAGQTNPCPAGYEPAKMPGVPAPSTPATASPSAGSR